MASIWDFLNDDTATTDQLFMGISPEAEEEETQVEETIVTPTPAGPVRAARITKEPVVKKFWRDEEGNLLSEKEVDPETAILPPSRVEIEKPSKNISKPEVQTAIQDFYAGREAATGGDWIDTESPMAEMVRGQQAALDMSKEPTALQKKYEEMGLEYDYTKRAERGSVLSEEKFAEREAEREQQQIQRQALDAKLDFKLNELKNQFEVVTQGQDMRKKFAEIEKRKNRSIDSIDKAELKVVANKEYATSPAGELELRKLDSKRQEILMQSISDQEKLGLRAWEIMPPDAKLTYTRMKQTGQVNPKDAIEYTQRNYEITKGAQTLKIDLENMGIDKNKINEIDDYIFGKKQLTNGQVQYDQDNEPIRAGKGLVFKNQFGIYEPSVDMATFESGLKNIARQFSPAKAEGGTTAGGTPKEEDPIKEAENLQKRIELINKGSKSVWEADGLPEGEWTLEAAVKAGKTEKAALDTVKELSKQVELQATTGKGLTLAEIETMTADAAKSNLTSKLGQLEDNPDPIELQNLASNGTIRTFTVEDNKLVEVESDATPTIRNEEYVIINDPQTGPQLVNIGKDKIKKFKDDANKFFYVDGSFTSEAPSILGSAVGTAIRASALGLAPSLGLAPDILAERTTRGLKTAPKAESIFNKNLETALTNRKSLKETTKAKEKKRKITDLKWE
jgi:hypothetical protein